MAILPRRQPFILFRRIMQIGRSLVSGSVHRVADGTIPAAFKVTESTVTSKGVIISIEEIYECAYAPIIVYS